MRKGWRFGAWPEGGYVELVPALEATTDEQRGALNPSRAWWVLRRSGIGAAGVWGTPGASSLRELVQDEAGLGRLSNLREGDLLDLLEQAIRSERLLVVPAAKPAVMLAPLDIQPVVLRPQREPAPAPAATAAPPEPAPDLVDGEAQAAVLRAAARNGIPFCEQCVARARAAAAGRPAGATGATA